MAGVAGYSAKPLWDKLGFDPGEKLVLIDAPEAFAIPGAPDGLLSKRELGRRRARSHVAGALAFFLTLQSLRESLPVLAERVFPDGAIWVAWPRRAGGHDSDIREQDIRDLALPLGLVDVKVAALDEHWSGLRLVWRTERRRASPADRG